MGHAHLQASLYPIQKAARIYAESLGQLDDVEERDVALPALHAADVGAVEPRLKRQRFLGQAVPLPVLSDSVAEASERLYAHLSDCSP